MTSDQHVTEAVPPPPTDRRRVWGHLVRTARDNPGTWYKQTAVSYNAAVKVEPRLRGEDKRRSALAAPGEFWVRRDGLDIYICTREADDDR